MYIFDSCDLNNDGIPSVLSQLGVLSTEEIQKCIYFVLKMDASVEPEMLEEMTIQHTRNVGMIGRLHAGVRAAAHRYDARNQSGRSD